MSVEKTTPVASFDHILSAIRHEVSDEYSALNIHFIKFSENALDALNAKQSEITSVNGGQALYDTAISALNEYNHDTSFCAACINVSEKHMLGLRNKTTGLAICMINDADLNIFEDQTFAHKFFGYATACEAIYKHLQKETKQTAPSALGTTLRLKLMGDCFASMALESAGVTGTTQNILKKLCALSTQKTINFDCAAHPLPMAADGLNVVYKDLKDEIPPKTGPLAHAYFMAEEIANTYDDISLKQWVSFCTAAQDMAWAGYSTQEILSAAAYGADNPHIRAVAHICAEGLNTNPMPLKNNEEFNPFNNEEDNERLHLRLCRAAFDSALKEAEDAQHPEAFLKAARKQTIRLLDGNPLGWCAPALIEAENAWHTFKDNPHADQNAIANAFESICSQIKWRDLQQLNTKLSTLRAKNKTVTGQTVLSLIKDKEQYRHFRNAFEV